MKTKKSSEISIFERRAEWYARRLGDRPGTNEAPTGRRTSRVSRADRRPIAVKLTESTRRVGECLEWAGCLTQNGYGFIGHAGRMWRAHRLVWTLHHGQIPAGGVIQHRCDNPRCVRIEHLELGTHRTNQADKVIKGRQARLERNGRAKLTPRDVSAIRKALAMGSTKSSLSNKYGVSERAIRKIETGETWGAHLANPGRTNGAPTVGA